ncbi:MAG: methyltransferase type 11 [Sphingopyxis sp.]
MVKRVTIATIVTAALVAAAIPAAAVMAQHSAAEHAAHAAIAAAVAATTRTEANRARDVWRHPSETLSFFGARPNETVVELWPGGGWYTEILAPLVHGQGTLYAAAPWDRLTNIRGRQTANADLYGPVRLTEFPSPAGSTNPRVPDGSADLVLTFRNVHNWRFGGADNASNAFAQIFAMLKPGGRLGIVEHRLPEDMNSAMEERSGYMKRSSVVDFAEAAGFQLVAESDINANPRDTHDHPRGVWTLPPVSQGAAEDPNRAAYLAIGESDRMTLLFVKPAG